MKKIKALSNYVKHLTDRCVRMYDQDFCDQNEELIETAARNKRLLDRFDMEIDNGDLTVVSTGSQGQMKEDINPIVKHRNDVAKLYADNLDALQLTPRSKYKKAENNDAGNKEDKLMDFLNSINK